jgi:hypothetical protein
MDRIVTVSRCAGQTVSDTWGERRLKYRKYIAMRTGAAHDSVTDIQYMRGAVLTYEDISATGWPEDQGRTLNPAAALPSISHQFAELCLGLCCIPVYIF